MGKTTLFLNGEILTVSAGDELWQAMLIEDGHIVFVGEEADALSLSDEDTEIVDLEKRAIIPGFINTYPTDFSDEGDEVWALEEKAREVLSVGWTTLRLTADCLGHLRHLVADGALTESEAPYLFALYEHAELLCERSRFIRLPMEELGSDLAIRRAEWAISDRRPIALDADGEESMRIVSDFLSSLSLGGSAASRNRLYLSCALEQRYLSRLLSRRVLPVFLSSDLASAASVLGLRERGFCAVAASDCLEAPLSLLSRLLLPLGDDYRRVPPFLSVATLHAAELESVADCLGSLEWGKRADFLILSGPLIGCPPDRLAELGIKECWIGGRRL